MSVFSEKDTFLLPDSLARTYEVRSCLKYSEQTATYLLCEKLTGHLFLLKTAADPVCAELLVNEKNILEFIHQTKTSAVIASFPVPVLLEVYDGITFYIRTYIEGKTLEELCETSYAKPGLPVMRALDYIISLTEILQFFHSMDPPLIHRDIKPQNVIVDAEGGCHFIDFGISRFYSKDKKGDTLIMGTKLTAPPEQFGFQQTDMRSDLYSLGILFYYCITGQYEVDEKLLAELDPALQQIILKVTMFDPDKRYQSADELLPVLLRARYPKVTISSRSRLRQHWMPLLFGILLSANLTVFCTLLYKLQKPEYQWLLSSEPTQTDDIRTRSDGSLQNTTELSDPLQEEYIFTESLIEEAVRTQLNKPDGPITCYDLTKITELRIFGFQIYTDESDFLFKHEYPWCFDHNLQAASIYQQTGTISSLEDIVHMPNLTALCLYNQRISDISLLKDMPLQELGLGYNPLTDLAPLRGNESIRYLNLVDLAVSDMDLISSLPNLTSLNLSGTEVTTLDPIEKCPIEVLNLYQTNVSDLSVLNRLPDLDELMFDVFSEAMLTQIEGVPIRTLTFYYSNNLDFDRLSVFPNLEKLYFAGSHMQQLQIQDPQLLSLTSLEFESVSLSDFQAFAPMKALTTLYIYHADFASYEGLEQLPNLTTIYCTEEQWQAIQAAYPDNSYYFSITSE